MVFTEGVEAALKLHGIPALHDDTATHMEMDQSTESKVQAFADRRVQEIGQYLADHPNVTHWVAIDDIDLAMADRLGKKYNSLFPAFKAALLLGICV